MIPWRAGQTTSMRVLLPLIRPLAGAGAARISPRPRPAGEIHHAPRACLSSRTHRTLPLFANAAAEAEAVSSLRGLLPRRSLELLDLGALRGASRDTEGRVQAPVLRSLVNASPPGEARHETVVAFNVLLRRLHVAARCCPDCLYPRARCLCARVRRVPPPSRAKLWVFQHVGEFGRSKNSGSLLCLVAGAERATRGIREHQQAMLDDLDDANRTGSAVVLFPTADALDVTEFVARRRDRLGLKLARETPLRVVVLDGTGRQARNLERFLPDRFPRVKLSIDEEFGSDSWLNPIRMQTEAHRVCSAQAASSVLELLGEKPVAAAVEDAVGIVVKDLEKERASIRAGAKSVFG